MIVDVHTHIWSSPDQLGPDATERIRRARTTPWDRPSASPDDHLAAMEPVTHAFVLGFVSHRVGANIDASFVASYVQRYPDRYFGFAGIDPMTGSLDEQLETCERLGFAGVTICPAAQGYHPCHTRAMDLYAWCEQRSYPVIVHPGSQFSKDSMMEFAQPHLFDEVARQFPQLKVIIAQVGYPWIDPTLMLIGKHPNIWADLSDLVLRPWPLYNALLSAHQLGVIDRLLLGSDFPFCTPEQAITTIYSTNTYTQGTHLPSVPREQLRSIVERDVLTELGLRTGSSPESGTLDSSPGAVTSHEGPAEAPPLLGQSHE